jgi:hypothetical protein
MKLVLDQHFASGDHLLYASDGQFWSFGGTHWAPLPTRSVEQSILKLSNLCLEPKATAPRHL